MATQPATQTVGLLFGGCSGEHKVSISSARAIARGLTTSPNSEKYTLLPIYIRKDGQWCDPLLSQTVLASGQALPAIAATPSRWQFPTVVSEVDIWFPILHGPNGEDGTIQGLLQLMQVPYVGPGVLASAMGMDKIAMKMAFAQAGLPQVNYTLVLRTEVWATFDRLQQVYDRVEAAIGYPCFVKPANLGSSVGIAKVRSRAELATALDNAASYDRRIIVEAGVTAREVECAVLGNDQPQASVVGEITFASDFYDYDTKYTAGLADLMIPASLPEAVTMTIQDYAIRAFQAVDGAGIGRVDFFYVEATGEILINEINTMPGFTATSMYPLLWQASGVEFVDLVDRLIQLGLERSRPLATSTD